MATASTPPTPAEFRQLKQRLGLQVITFAGLLLAAFGVAAYSVIAEEYQRAQRQEVNHLVEVASSQLPLLAHEFHEPNNERRFNDDRMVVAVQDRGEQRVRWFDSAGQLIDEQGGLGLPPPPKPRMTSTWQRWSGGVARWQPVQTLPRHGDGVAPKLDGYVQVGVSNRTLEQDLQHLRNGLMLGGVCATLAALLVGRQMLRAATAPLQRQVWALERFTGDASHELRHPLTLMRTVLATAMGEPTSTPPNQKLIVQIDGIATRMAVLLDDLLLLARHEQGVGEGRSQGARWQRFELSELLEDLLNFYEARAAARQVTLQLDTAEKAEGGRLWGQPEQLQRLFTNVLVNAIDHSPEGGVVQVRLHRSRMRLVVQIIDSGGGIAAEDQKRVFERFWQGEGIAAPEPGHSGLGLAIARAIARNHGGEIRLVDGRPGHCVFAVELPSG